MPKGENQKLKLFYLAKILQEKTDEEHFLTMPDILQELEKYGVSAERKSIYDDVRALQDLGIDVVADKVGRGCHYRVLGREFELAELKLLVDAIQSSKFITEKKSRALIKKIEGLTSVHQAKKLHRQVYVQGRIKTMNESIYYSVDDIHSAIANNKKIKFQYTAWNIKKELEVKHGGKYYVMSPWGLSWDDENYYLVAYDSELEKVKHFRVDKMIKISVLDEPRDGKEFFKNLDMAEYAKKNFGMFGGEEASVKLEIPNSMVGVFIDRFGTGISVRTMNEDTSYVTIFAAVSHQFFGWILGLGPDVKIVSPDNVVDDMKDYLKAISARYDT